jgi:hypothetical protein
MQGFIYSAGEYIELLPSGWSSAYTVAINEAETVAGYGYDGITDKGFVYSKGGYSDILPTGWGYAAAGDINEYGTVVGYGADSAGIEKAFIATPLVVDNCPDDPLKTEPGICGCGVPDNDTDSDAIPDCADNCLSVANNGQEDFDADGTGDPCDTDRDGDNTTNANDCAPDDAAAFKPWIVYADTDADGYGADSAITLCGNDMAPAGYSVNNTDNCPDAANADQNDADGDGTGDLCDTDRDGDGVANGSDCAPDNAAAFKPWIVYADTDADGYGAGSATSVCGNDTAPAGYSINNTDNCPDAANADQRDADGDGIGDLCEQIQAVDSDNDGIPDSDDLYPYSNMKKRIIIKGYNTGVKSRLFADGSTMNDLIDECYLSNKTSKSHKRDKSHKAFLSCVAKLTQEWKALGFISSREKCVILLIAALVR